jgi:hypothetical protein
VRNPLAGKKAKVLYRNPDKSTVLQVEDAHDEILVTVSEDGTMFEERWSGIKGVREAWQAAAPGAGAMLLPDDAGRQHWTKLESEPKAPTPTPAPKPAPEPEPSPGPEPAPAPVPEVSRGVQHAALVLAARVWDTQVVSRAEMLGRINPPHADRYVNHAVAMGWMVADGDRLTKGAVSPRQDEPIAEGPGGWEPLHW